MDLEELLIAKERIEQEIALRLNDDQSVQIVEIGEYICGTHIKTGRYEFTNADTVDKYRRVMVFENQEAQDNWDHILQYNLEPNQSAVVELKDGMVLGIYDGPLLIEEASFIFAP